MKNLIRRTVILFAAAVVLITVSTLHAQAPDPEPALVAPEHSGGGSFNLQPAPTPDPGLLQPLVDGLTGKYGWLTTVLLAISSLRILFKPLMLVVENTVKND